MTSNIVFSAEVLRLDEAAECARIEAAIRRQMGELRRRGAVVGLSGGIDSSVVAALCVRALGKDRVLGLLMPEMEVPDDSLRLGRLAASSLGIQTELEDISPLLEAAGAYRRRDDAIRSVIPEYGDGWKSKIVLPGSNETSAYQMFSVVVRSPEGEEKRARLPLQAYLRIVAATSFKQRGRKMMEYYHADRLNYAVAGTPNLLEYDQGFFVKGGDGVADFKPIAHLYKSQVYALARHMDIPEEILQSVPTTGTYSLPQTQEEFYFTLPYDQMDLCLYGRDHGIPAEDVACAIALTTEEVERTYRIIDSKRKATRYLHLSPLLVERKVEAACS